jgi:hypothetical protein
MKITFRQMASVCLTAFLLVTSLRAQQKSRGEPSELDRALVAEADIYPCGDVNLSDTVRELEKNVIAFLNYDGDELVSIDVKPTCKYREAHMPKWAGDPLMSKNTFRRLMTELEKIKPVGRKVTGAMVSPVSGPLKWTTDRYENADVEVVNYRCEKPRKGFGCDIRKFVVYYKNGGI